MSTGTTPSTATRYAYPRFVVIGFVVLLWLPIVGYVFNLDPTPSSRRGLSPTPHLATSMREIRWMHTTAVRYVNDHFGFRDLMLRLHGQLKVKLLGISSNPDVILGQQGWLFFAAEGSLDNYRRTDPFTTSELEQFASALESRRQWLAAQGIQYVFVLMPDKSTVYSEFMSSELRPLPGPSRREQLIDYLKTHTQVRAVDVTERLRNSKSLGRLYYKTDTHWNCLGGLVGSVCLSEELSRQVPQLEVERLSDYELVTKRIGGGDLARCLGLKFDFFDQEVSVCSHGPSPAGVGVPMESMDIANQQDVFTSNPTAPISKAVIFRDSFANAWIPFAWKYFQQAVWIWSYDWDCDRIRREQPQIVIDQWVERRLMTVMPSAIDPAEPVATVAKSRDLTASH